MEVLEQELDVALGHPAAREGLAERSTHVDHVVARYARGLVRPRERVGVTDERRIVREPGHGAGRPGGTAAGRALQRAGEAARLLAGEPALFGLFENRFLTFCASDGAGSFITAKQAERDARHHRYGETPFLVEPNIKEGRGGLRDVTVIQSLVTAWLADQPHGRLDDATDLLLDVRDAIHVCTGRGRSRLTRDLHDDVAALLGLPEPKSFGSARAGAAGGPRACACET